VASNYQYFPLLASSLCVCCSLLILRRGSKADSCLHSLVMQVLPFSPATSLVINHDKLPHSGSEYMPARRAFHAVPSDWIVQFLSEVSSLISSYCFKQCRPCVSMFTEHYTAADRSLNRYYVNCSFFCSTNITFHLNIFPCALLTLMGFFPLDRFQQLSLITSVAESAIVGDKKRPAWE
jgi:hypothetical protein